MRPTILLSAIVFGILSGMNLGVSVAFGRFVPLSFVTSVILIGLGLLSMNLACDMPVNKRKFWKTARGDHMLTAAVVTAISMTTIIAKLLFENAGFFIIVWMIGVPLFSIILVSDLIPREWIDFDGKIPPHTFWKELFS